MNDITTILEKMVESGLEALPSNIITDGKIHRFGKNNTSWYVAYQLENGIAGSFGDWKLGGGSQMAIKFMISDKLKPSKEDIKNLKEEYLRKKRITEEQEKAKRKKVETISRIIFNKSSCSIFSHNYLKKKKIEPPFFIKEIEAAELKNIIKDNYSYSSEVIQSFNKSFYKEESLLVIPMYDALTQNLKSLQLIHENGRKSFFKGGVTKNVYFPIGTRESLNKKVIYFTEGYATGMSIKKIVENAPVVVCFSAGNLPNVVKSFRKRYPDYHFVICADNDYATKPKNGFGIENPGLNYGKQAKMLAGENSSLCYPVFKDEMFYLKEKEKNPNFKVPTDFNDLELIEGKENLLKQLVIYDPEFESHFQNSWFGRQSQSQLYSKTKSLNLNSYK